LQVAVLFIIKFASTATFTQIFCLRARPRRRLYRLFAPRPYRCTSRLHRPCCRRVALPNRSILHFAIGSFSSWPSFHQPLVCQPTNFAAPTVVASVAYQLTLFVSVLSLALVLSTCYPADNFRSPDTRRRCRPPTTSLVFRSIQHINSPLLSRISFQVSADREGPAAQHSLQVIHIIVQPQHLSQVLHITHGALSSSTPLPYQLVAAGRHLAAPIPIAGAAQHLTKHHFV